MSHSTTATSTYKLRKYSKSYPATRGNTQAGQPSDQLSNENNTTEWQHFTNPIIRLVLDTKKAVNADLLSVRLRILWSMDAGDAPTNTNHPREVEDIDLLTLSCLPQQLTQNRHQVQGLPLKAVYRDAVVGVRYLHSRDPNVAPLYRRFQMTFLSPSAALEFIDAIGTVCPCRANPIANSRREPDPSPRSNTISMNIYNRNAPQSQHQGGSSTAYIPSPLTGIMPLSLGLQNTIQNPPAYIGSSQGLTTSTSQMKTKTADPVASGAYANPTIRGLLVEMSLPSSSPPTTSARASNDDSLYLPPGDNIDTGMQTAAIINTLRESTALYDLPPSTLERLVGDIVREDGFMKLLENVGSMWGARSFVGV